MWLTATGGGFGLPGSAMEMAAGKGYGQGTVVGTPPPGPPKPWLPSSLLSLWPVYCSKQSLGCVGFCLVFFFNLFFKSICVVTIEAPFCIHLCFENNSLMCLSGLCLQ